MTTDPFPTPDPVGEPEPAARVLAPGDQLGRYRVLKLAGIGWMGTVYAANDALMDRLVAIKVLRPQFVEQYRIREKFLRDTRQAAAVRHENVITFYAVEEIDGVLVLVMEWLTGQSLADSLLKGGGLGPLQIRRIGREIARGLSAIHSQGLVHRRIKPANIWLTAPKGQVKILDSTWVVGSGEAVSSSTTALLTETPGYMSPEQAMGNPTDHRSDLFSLGVLLYRMCSGHLPFYGDSTPERLFAIVHKTPPPARVSNPIVPPEMDALIMRLLSKDPADRPASADEVADALSRPMAWGNYVKTTRPVVSAPPPKPVPRTRATPAAGGPTSLRPAPIAFAVESKGGRMPLLLWPLVLPFAVPVLLWSWATSKEPGHGPPPIPATDSPPRRPRSRRWLNPLAWFRRSADPVDVTAFAPPAVAAGNAVMVQLFAHVPEKAAEAKKLATLFDAATAPRGVTSLELEVRRGTVLNIHLTAGPLTVDQHWQKLVWRGKTAAVQFAVAAAGNLTPQTVVATAQVFQNAVPVGVVRFKLEVVAAAQAGAPVATGDGTRYRTAFISYATPDRAEVLKRVQALRAVRVEVFQDILALEPGERWERKLYERIDACDLFLLFWSAAATKSEWVRKELQYAVGRKSGNDELPPDIVPVVLDGPPSPEPPSELKHLHFDDYLAHLIRGAG